MTSVPPARRSPSRRRQLQPVMHSLPSLPPSMLLATLHRIPMRIRCEWNVGTPSLALLLALLGYKLGRASVCPLPSAARASHWQCSARTSRRPNEVGRLLGRGACSLGAGKTQNALRCSAAPPSNLLTVSTCRVAPRVVLLVAGRRGRQQSRTAQWATHALLKGRSRSNAFISVAQSVVRGADWRFCPPLLRSPSASIFPRPPLEPACLLFKR